MKRIVHINFDGKLIGKGRPRFSKGHVYTPSKTRSAEASLSWAAKQAMGHERPMIGPVFLFCNVLVAYPKTWTKKRIGETSPFCDRKPDADNQIKLIGDALNGIVWLDDSQIAKIDFQRTWWPSDHVHIRVEQL